MLGHAGMQTPGSPLRVPVSISVNRGDPRALTQRGLELSLEHRGSVEISRAHPEGFGNGKGGVTEMPPRTVLPLPASVAKHRLSFTLASGVPSPAAASPASSQLLF